MLHGWAKAAADHWMEYRPKMYSELVRSGQLEERANRAAELTKDALVHGLQKGLPYDQAWEAVREMWMYLPSEEEAPDLTQNPQSQPDPSCLASIMESPKSTK